MIAATCITFAVTYLQETDESKLHLPHPASLALSPQNLERENQVRVNDYELHTQTTSVPLYLTWLC